MDEHAGAGLEGLLDEGHALGEARKEVARVRVLQALYSLVRELLAKSMTHAHTRAHTTHTSNQPQDAHANVVDSSIGGGTVRTVGWRVSTPMERMWVMLRLRR